MIADLAPWASWIVVKLWVAIARWGLVVYNDRGRTEERHLLRVGHTCVQCEVPSMRSISTGGERMIARLAPIFETPSCPK